MNKHKTITILIVPFLALGGYILADIYSNKKIDKSDKRLFVTGECKPVEDSCEILGIGMEMHLKFNSTPRYQELLSIELNSKTSLDDVAMSLIVAGNELAPVKMKNTGNKKNWIIKITPADAVTKDDLKVRLAVSYKASLHFVEFPIKY
jgi:hypothetical protein